MTAVFNAQTVRMSIKLVPDDAPNANGVWVEVDGPAPPAKVFDWTPVIGQHVVAYSLTRSDKWPQAGTDLQDGGPMHAAFLGGGR
jgi:hypothetical protein